MKAIIAALFTLGFAALSYAGFATYSAFPGFTSTLSVPYAYTPAYSAFTGNYKLTFDTSLPLSAYAYYKSYSYAAAPTAYGYGVIKV